MNYARTYMVLAITVVCFTNCKKGSGGSTPPPAPPPASLNLISVTLDGKAPDAPTYNASRLPLVKFSFSTKIDRSTVGSSLTFTNASAVAVSYTASYQNGDSSLIVQPASLLAGLTRYFVHISSSLKSTGGQSLSSAADLSFITQIDSTDKFPVVSDSALLDLVQHQTFRYFWDFGHPVSGLSRERNTSGDLVTIGGSGFGVMAILTGISRNFITRQQGLTRMQTMVGFLKNTAQKFHGAFPHWMNGVTGAVIPFNEQGHDDGADIVETSYMMMGLLCARQFFNGGDAAETGLRTDIDSLWHGVEWDWFRQGGKNVLYWNWSPGYGFFVNTPVQGWNEALITYVMAASSTTHGIPKAVYDSGYARNGAMKNGNSFYGYTLPLGPDYGGPLFFEHYSFMGIKPKGLTDQYASYETQTVNHTRINYEYCRQNPKKYFGYSDQCWGLTASDVPNGYQASSPLNDLGVIAPTAAISSLAYTPAESMKALKFFYYKLGDKLWGQYGFYDAFSLKDLWYSNSYLAIDEGPIVVMVENYRTGLLWNLFMSCPEVKTGMQSLGFQSPYL